MSTPLEEERRALLARMQASREVYRSRFPSKTHTEIQDPHVPPPLTREPAFPRSHTFRFIGQHPYAAAVVASALIAAIPGGAVKKAVKGGAVFAAGIIGSQARTLLVRELLPSIIHLTCSSRRTGGR
jgi:hypothetical protein